MQFFRTLLKICDMHEKDHAASYTTLLCILIIIAGVGLVAAKESPLVVSKRNVIVYADKGMFCGWPANEGAWSWGNEILVAFVLGYYSDPPDYDPTEHHISWKKPIELVTARSFDGGESWQLERPEAFARLQQNEEAIRCPGGIDFAHPDFAMRLRKRKFWVSYDRGRTWSVPYKLPTFGARFSTRADYIVNGPNECLFFFTASPRPICARTTDGGKSIEYVSWMVPFHRARSIMPSTVRTCDSRLVAAVREIPGEDYVSWIDTYVSNDNGRSWKFLSKVADADRKHWNGNPPSMIRLKDARLCVTYAYRAAPWGIRAKLSSDDGRTWSDEIVLRDDGLNWDLGYARTKQRPDGKIVTMYYYSTKDQPHQFIGGTIWEPPAATAKN